MSHQLRKDLRKDLQPSRHPVSSGSKGLRGGKGTWVVESIKESLKASNGTLSKVHPALAGWAFLEFLTVWFFTLAFIMVLQITREGKFVNLRIVQLFTRDVNRGFAAGVQLAAAGGGDVAPPRRGGTNNSYFC
ncbi:hypothetical protein P167DRAFT_571602 [Morchella conica CCBAS932]|uniref:Uncharacterized protein n=1 Tax=Morchella conica CCBAS932 TaxID=1392247 RepID=A0A3N4KX63_9PEZI|nr:hypothetical protein P167DRAFT_571602 [Morchella conica CCBAS932]